MDTKEIMTNDEVVETNEEIMNAENGNGFKIAVGIGLAVLAGGIAYKYIVKPITAKIKAKKEQRVVEEVEIDCIEVDSESEEN